MADATERFADDQAVLIGEDWALPAFVAAPAESLTPRRLARLHELSGGMVVLALDDAGAARLALAQGLASRRGPTNLPFLTSIDAAQVTSGGWSIADRAMTIRVAADPQSSASDVLTPGHVHPIRVGADDLLQQPDTAAAALELARLSAKRPAVALGAVVDRCGVPVAAAAARAAAGLSRLSFASTAELRAQHRARRTAETSVECLLPTRDGAFRVAAHLEEPTATTTMALAHGDPGAHTAPFVYIHTACVLGEALGSLLCDCGARLDQAVADIVEEGTGIVIYIKPNRPVYQCGRAWVVDAPAVAGLLRRAGVERLRLEHGSERLAVDLAALGIRVEHRLARAT